MKRISLVSWICAAALGAACHANGNQADRNTATPGSDVQQSGSAADRTGPGAETGTAGTSGLSSDQSNSSTARTSGSAAVSGSGDVQQFVQQAAAAGMAEVQLGQLAEKQASSSQVKEFARMMVRDHTKANNDLKRAAQGQNLQLPTELDQKHQDLMQRLQQLRGADFDREYMSAMVDDHMQARDLLSDRAQNNQRGSAATGSASGTGTSGANGSTASATGTSGRSSDAQVNQWASKTLPDVEHHLMQAQQINSRLQGGGAAGANGSSRSNGNSSGSGAASGSSSGSSGPQSSGAGSSSGR